MELPDVLLDYGWEVVFEARQNSEIISQGGGKIICDSSGLHATIRAFV